MPFNSGMAIKLGREIARTLCAGVVVHLMVVSACSAGGGGPSGDPTPYTSTRLDGADPDAVPGTPQNRPDAGGTSLLVPVKEAQAQESGTRLKARYYSGADGSRQFLNWFDSELGTQCSFADLGDGVLRCVPPVTGVVHYADSACTQIIYSTINNPCGATQASFLRVPYPDSNGACSPQYRYFEPGAQTTPQTLYNRSGTGCVEVNVDAGQTYWFAGAELPITSFVSGQIVTE